ncbi:MAG TPA: ATP-binding cassette domain-containing protein, partial [Ilumatobacteraceae bacterium]
MSADTDPIVHRRYARVAPRLSALIIDFIVLAVFGQPALAASFVGHRPTLAWVLLPVGLVAFIVIWSLQVATGLSWGQQSAGVAIVDKTSGEPIGFGRALLRCLVQVVSVIPVFLGFAMALWDKRKQTLHDKIVGSVVVATSAQSAVRIVVGAEAAAEAGGTTSGSQYLLDARKVRVEFGGLTAVNDVDFNIPHGSIVALIGPNGAGKTTFFNVLTGLYTPTRGSVHFDDVSVVGVAPHKIAASGMARTFQNIRLFGAMTASENVMVAMHPHLASGVVSTIITTPKQRREEREARAVAKELLEFVGIGGVDDEFAKNLPYGDQRRLEVARALALRPKLLLLDEPTAGMNPQESATF